MRARRHFHKYLNGHNVTVFTAVKAVLQAPNQSSKHARCWTKVYGSEVKDVHGQIIFRVGKKSLNANVLSCQPYSPVPREGVAEGEMQVCAVTNKTNI